ncbi:hypothetical protein [Saccharothrix algeriensis]|uniref:Uncharacterized protein n=1 Tax=Saccharothrix algeriensis TaxID=173560 RepID=A0A8T8HSF9_9PSEU|nr:hypothetical protein [Saccharothrix algeriensis]MBM7812653.1 hypothetical protein [Saccharothrix algeriensis]QTR01357.1 hypothetical protein J7S33_18110 [Saccharothrix algeriensis]
MTIAKELSGRAKAMLRAVAAGRGELSGGREPDLYVDGLPCCDQMVTHALVEAGLLRARRVVRLDERTAAVLTEAGRAAIA